MSADTPGGEMSKISITDESSASTTRPRAHSRSIQRKTAPEPVSVPVYEFESSYSGTNTAFSQQASAQLQNGHILPTLSPRRNASQQSQISNSGTLKQQQAESIGLNTQPYEKSRLGDFTSLHDSSVRASLTSVLNEVIAGVLIPLPFLLLPIIWSTGPLELSTVPIPSRAGGEEAAPTPSDLQNTFQSGFFSVCLITAGTLLCIGLAGELRSLGQNAKTQTRSSSQHTVSLGTARRLIGRLLSIGLPYYAASKLGGERIALILLTSLAADLMSTKPKAEALIDSGSFLKTVLAHRFVLAAIMVQILIDVTGLTNGKAWPSISGYVAILTSVLVLPVPYLTTRPKASVVTSPVSKKTMRSQLLSSPLEGQLSSSGEIPEVQSPLISTPWDTDLTLASGVLAGFIGVIVLLLAPDNSRAVSQRVMLGGVLIISTSTLSFLLATPRFLRSSGHVGALVGIAATICSGFFSSVDIIGILLQIFLGGASWIAVEMDSRHNGLRSQSAHGISSRSRRPSVPREPHSKVTGVLLKAFENWPLLHSILVEKDSRRIFYFMSLNFAFMMVQTFYGYVSKSLGLLSDSVHMFFDCVALLVGLAAAVMSKWPPDLRFPYGYGMIDTLAGFANGVFLMLISLEIVYEAIERLAEGVQIQRLTELLVVSTLGLLVNCVGMMAFGHAHHGHGHDHGHSHHHSHEHSDHSHHHSHDESHSHHHSVHNHDYNHDHDHDHDPHAGHAHDTHETHSHSHSHPHSHSHSHHHHHSHGNENMIGIWLHILADTLGSAAVVVSTLLVHFTGWPGFDPLASCLIAILIFGSAIPLVTSTAKRLLLTVPESTEFDIREAITGVSDLTGVVGVTIPRVWAGSSDSGNVQGVMHVLVNRSTDIDDARKRILSFLRQKNMDVLVQVEREGDTRCWCGAAMAARRD